MIKIPKIFKALVVQLLVLLALALLVYLAKVVIAPPYPYSILVLIQAIGAVAVTAYLRWPRWWLWIQFLIPVGLYGALLMDFDPLIALGLFVVIWLVFANAFQERVPLYLTNSTTREALKKLVKTRRNQRFLDLGCGLGGNVAYMSQLKSVDESHGVETAPIPYLISKMLTWFRGGKTYAMDMWNTDLAYYDVVYAFLSPEPMEKLWIKIKEEMQPGSVFITNSFKVPEVEPSEIWELDDARATVLYIYYV